MPHKQYFNNNLICCDTRIGHPVTFFLISKLNGAKITDFKIPYKKKITSTFYFQQEKGLTRAVKFPYNEVIGTKDEIIFNEISADTIFKLTVDEKLEPLDSYTFIIGTISTRISFVNGTNQTVHLL